MFEGSGAAGFRSLRLAAMISAAILTLAGLWAASAVMTPVVFSLFIIALVWPLQRRLQTVLPQVIAVLVTAVVVLLAIGGGGWLVVLGNRTVGDCHCRTAPGSLHACCRSAGAARPLRCGVVCRADQCAVARADPAGGWRKSAGRPQLLDRNVCVCHLGPARSRAAGPSPSPDRRR